MPHRVLRLLPLTFLFACALETEDEARLAELSDAEDSPAEALAASPSTPATDDDPSCAADFTRVDPGEVTDDFVAVSPEELQFHDGLGFALDPDSNTAHAKKPGGITMTCRCGDSCSGGSACSVSSTSGTAVCSGTCDGNCGGCSWHYGDIPAPGGSGTGATWPSGSLNPWGSVNPSAVLD